MSQTSPPGDLRLIDFAPTSELVVDAHPVDRARFPVIDAHNHVEFVGFTPDAVDTIVAEMDACNVVAMMDLGPNRKHPLDEALAVTKGRYPDRFYTLSVTPWQQALDDDANIGQTLASAISRDVQRGADGMKVFKTLGLGLRDKAGRLVMPDDPRFAPLWDQCADLNVPVLIHTADPTAFFKPLDRHNERYEELVRHPAWHVVGDDLPSYAQLMDAHEHLIARHPDTTFQSAHVASSAENLRVVADLLDRYANLYVDISARCGELGRQPYTARDFFIRYADRILYGTDVTPNADAHRTYFRCLETRDEYFPYSQGETPAQGRWHIHGLNLPDDVLRKVYHQNAQRLYGQTPRPIG